MTWRKIGLACIRDKDKVKFQLSKSDDSEYKPHQHHQASDQGGEMQPIPRCSCANSRSLTWEWIFPTKALSPCLTSKISRSYCKRKWINLKILELASISLFTPTNHCKWINLGRISRESIFPSNESLFWIKSFCLTSIWRMASTSTNFAWTYEKLSHERNNCYSLSPFSSLFFLLPTIPANLFSHAVNALEDLGEFLPSNANGVEANSIGDSKRKLW